MRHHNGRKIEENNKLDFYSRRRHFSDADGQNYDQIEFKSFKNTQCAVNIKVSTS